MSDTNNSTSNAISQNDASTPEDQSRSNRFWRITITVGLGLLAVVGLSSWIMGGCVKSKPINSSITKKVQVEDPWPSAAAALRRDTDTLLCRRVLNELNAALPMFPAEEQLKPLTAEESAAVVAALRLDEKEAQELQSASFTPLDAHYLGECLYLRDAARTLDVADAPTARRASSAFNWVCRQVMLAPWRVPLPPCEALRRGAGSGLDRAAIFCGLGRQLDLDVYFIGQSGAFDWLSTHVPAGRKEAKGPFWAVGVRDGQDILLFDPWRGEPFPGKTPNRPATLAEVRARPEIMKGWLEDKARPWDVGAEDLRMGEPYVALPVSAAAGRMRQLEAKLQQEVDVRLFVDLNAVMKNAAEAAKTAQDAKARVWSPPNDRFCQTRVLRAFQSAADGDSATEVPSLPQLLALDQFPRSVLFVKLPGLTRQDAQEFFWQWMGETYRTAFQLPPTPRERIQRGNFQEAKQKLMATRDEFSTRAARLQLDGNREEARQNFIAKTESFFANDIARQRQNSALSSPAALNQSIQNYFKNHLGETTLVLDEPLCKAMLGEATYLLAIATHEQAERAQANLEKLKGEAAQRASQEVQLAWQVAADWWKQYEPMAQEQEADFPGRRENARQLALRAAQFLKK